MSCVLFSTSIPGICNFNHQSPPELSHLLATPLLVHLGRRGLAKGSSVLLASIISHFDWFTAVSRLHTSKRPPFSLLSIHTEHYSNPLTIHHTNHYPLSNEHWATRFVAKVHSTSQYRTSRPILPWPPSRIHPACPTLLPHLHNKFSTVTIYPASIILLYDTRRVRAEPNRLLSFTASLDRLSEAAANHRGILSSDGCLGT